MAASNNQYKLEYRGYLKGHNGWVTCMKMGEEETSTNVYQEFLISGSRDHKLMIWDLSKDDADEEKEMGKPRKVLNGHSHFVSDLDLSSDSRFALSSSWDGTIRLWNLKTATTRKCLMGHNRDVLSVAFSPDNRQIASGSMDKDIKIWNIHGVCKFTVDNNKHNDWVSCVRYYHDKNHPIVVSASWDKTIKVWDNTSMQLKHTFVGHKAQITTIDLAYNTNFIASGGKDGKVHIWNLIDGRHLEEIDVESPVNVVMFAPKLFWLMIGTEEGFRVYDLPHKQFIDSYTANELDKKKRTTAKIGCTSMVWSKNQQYLYAGFTDGFIRVFAVVNAP